MSVEEANKWWADSPDDFKIQVWKMFFGSSVIAYNPLSRTATTMTVDDGIEGD